MGTSWQSGLSRQRSCSSLLRAGSTPVPLKRIMFSWGGSAFWDGAAGSWTTGSLANYTVPGTSAGTTDYPVWSKHNDNTYVLE